MRRALEWLGGSVLVYGLMAACAGASGQQNASPEGRGGTVAGSPGGQPAVAAGEAAGGILDPVPPAMAAAGAAGEAEPWAVTTVPCDKTYDHLGMKRAYAELLLPGRSVPDLVRAVAYFEVGGDGVQGRPPGYENVLAAATLVRAGGIAVACSAETGDKVMFVVPPKL